MGEKSDEQSKIEGIFGRLNIATVDVDNITDALKGIEGDSYRQDNLQMYVEVLQAKHAEECTERIHEEIEVLEEAEEEQVNCNTRCLFHKFATSNAGDRL